MIIKLLLNNLSSSMTTITQLQQKIFFPYFEKKTCNFLKHNNIFVHFCISYSSC